MFWWGLLAGCMFVPVASQLICGCALWMHERAWAKKLSNAAKMKGADND